MRTSLIVFGHGSRDPQWRSEFHELVEAIRGAVQGRCSVHAAFLQFISPTLEEAARLAVVDGASQLHVLPIFLFSGQHVNVDLPACTDRIRREHPNVHIAVHPPVGETTSFRRMVTDLATEIAEGKM